VKLLQKWENYVNITFKKKILLKAEVAITNYRTIADVGW